MMMLPSEEWGQRWRNGKTNMHFNPCHLYSGKNIFK
jgi:hypothetical protein